jgi:hypothetical protein
LNRWRARGTPPRKASKNIELDRSMKKAQGIGEEEREGTRCTSKRVEVKEEM